jgi:fibronectin-binding autotransporter adhesin
MKRRNSPVIWARNGGSIVAALALVAGGGIPAEAQRTWTGDGPDAFWSTGENWGGTAPVATNSLVFTGTTQTSNHNDITEDTQFNGITFNNSSSSGSFTLSGSRITLGGNVTTTGATGNPGHAINLDIRLASSPTISVPSSTSVRFDGNISQDQDAFARSVGIQGGGGVIMTGSNSFTGTVSVNQGGLSVNSVADGGTASAIGSGTTFISMSSGGSFASLTYTGTGHSTNRAIRLAGTTAGSTINAQGEGAVTFNAPALLFANGTGNKTLTLGGTSTAANTFASTIGDESGTLTTAVSKTGLGTWTLSGSNTFSRGVSLGGGQLNLNNASAIGSGTMVVSNGTKLDNTSGSDITLSTANTVNIQQNFTFVGSNNLSFANGSATVGTQNVSTYTVTMDGSNSTLTFGVLTNVQNTGINSGNPSITVNNGAGNGNKLVLGSLNLSNSGTNFRRVTFGGNANIDISGGVANGTATNADLTYNGSGILALSGSNSYTGQTSITGVGGLLINGTHSGTGLTTVASGARIGGIGSLAGDLTIASNGLFVFNPANPTLDVSGAVTLANSFGVSSLVNLDGTGIDWGSVANGNYTLIGTTASTFSNIQNFGVDAAAPIDNGRTAYFTDGSLTLVIVPEPGAFALAGLGFGVSAWIGWNRRRISRGLPTPCRPRSISV